MELLLNLAWMLIALCGLAVWRGVWVHEKRRVRRAPLQEWTAFACALIFLFFAVSLSDDLHSDLILFDGDLGNRRGSLMSSDAHAARHDAKSSPSVAVATLSHAPDLGSFHVVAIVVLPAASSPACFSSDCISARAPPASL